jgi:hypothetical protein
MGVSSCAAYDRSAAIIALRRVSDPQGCQTTVTSTGSIKVASSASAVELLTRFDTGQRRTRNPKERDLDHIPLLSKGIQYRTDGRAFPLEPRVSLRPLRAPAFSSPGRGFSFAWPRALVRARQRSNLVLGYVRSSARSMRNDQPSRTCRRCRPRCQDHSRRAWY